MIPEITLDIPPDLTRWLDELETRVKRRGPLMEAIADIMMNAVDENFIESGRPAWEPLKYRNGKPLMDSGRLHASISPWHDNDQSVVGTNVIYARIHQLGGKTKPHIIRPKHKKALSFNGRVVSKVNHPGSDIPARPFLKLTDEDYAEIQQAIVDHIAGNT